MRISVIIPSYRAAAFLPQAVASVRRQTRQPDEIVVVAGTAEDARAARELEVIACVQEPTGISAARNMGISRATGNALLPLDADDMLVPTAIEELERNAPAGDRWIVSSDVLEFGDGDHYWAPEDVSKIRYRNCLSYASLFPRSLWALAGGYDTNAMEWEDWDFALRCMKHTPTVVQIRQPLLLYRRHADQKSEREKGREAEALVALRVRHGLT